MNTGKFQNKMVKSKLREKIFKRTTTAIFMLHLYCILYYKHLELKNHIHF